MKMDASNLYREETFTDLRAGTVRRLTPVKTDGSIDATRPTLFTGQAQLLTQIGPLPVSCDIPAKDLGEALDRFPEAIQRAVERMIEEVKEIQREQASQIVVPNLNPGGRIQLR
jgi:hypothetical protein